MVHPHAFHDVGRLPEPGDNVAIASRRLPAGTRIANGDQTFSTNHTILEGHRFACCEIAAGDTLLSWGLPFGVANRDIAPGTYVCNPKILHELHSRHLDFALPEEANFEDKIEPYQLDETTFEPGQQVPLHSVPRTFLGYGRPSPASASSGAPLASHICLPRRAVRGCRPDSDRTGCVLGRRVTPLAPRHRLAYLHPQALRPGKYGFSGLARSIWDFAIGDVR